MNAIDTNILVYSFDESEPTKRSTARQLIRQRISAKDTVLLWQVAVEFLGCLRRWQAAGRVTTDDVVDLFEDTLYSEDMQHDQVYDGVRVINPFV